jgi:prolyl-tRNA editing enzyme YbaK/EbsC (Cys-tRNA(Pro) deacylase)
VFAGGILGSRKEAHLAFSNPLTDALDRAGIAYELLEHEPTERAEDEAAELGLSPSEVAKTIVVTAGDANHRVLLPASERIDMHKLRDLLDVGKDLHLLSEESLRSDYPEFELGAVPPLGGREDGVVVDRRLAELEQLVFEAGSHSRSVRVVAAELVSATGARVADVCAD